VTSVSLRFSFSLVAAVASLAAAPETRSQGARPERYHEKIDGTLVTFEMRLVPGGAATFRDENGERTEDVAPFYIGVTEVTWDMYDVFALQLDRGADRRAADAIARPSNPYGAPDYGWGHAGFPAMSLTRQAAEAFCAWLSSKTGKAYRLPTESEWARAAALATSGRPLDGARRDAIAWHRGNASARTHAVATKTADGLGLFDFFGNVGEWVVPASGALILRGGTFRDPAESMGVPSRAVQDATWNETDPQLPKSRWWLSDAPFAGFRLAGTG
jgi:formylglycine-generating enzyme required for sulfatase activity